MSLLDQACYLEGHPEPEVAAFARGVASHLQRGPSAKLEDLLREALSLVAELRAVVNSVGEEVRKR
jgi:N-acetylglucosamine kinase-like BadF-type ATPase